MNAQTHPLNTAGFRRPPATFAQGSPAAIAADLFALTKPTITLLVAVTVVPSLLMASEGLPAPLITLAAVLGASLTSASAAVFNQLLEVGRDERMQRTRLRSLASGRLSPWSAVLFGILAGLLGLGMLYRYATPLAALVAAAGHLFYTLIYTLVLKKRTVQNIVIGGAAGAVGPLIGWAAVTGQLGWPAWNLFFIIFLWTPPHFWALALQYQADYKRVGIPMYPVVYGDHATRRQMLLYTLALLPCALAPWLWGEARWLYGITALVASSKFTFDAWQLYRAKHNAKAMAFFHYSCLYIFILFVTLTMDRLLWISQ